jgi:hypothetical protein
LNANPLNNTFATLGDIQAFVLAERASRNEADKNLYHNAQGDKETRMGIVD